LPDSDAQWFELMQTGDFVLIGVCFAAGFLVKPISIIVAAPFVALGTFRQLPVGPDGVNQSD